jgi:hypothetical protein
MAMPDSILDMRFNQNEEDFVDDEHFLQATYRAGIEVEKKNALKAVKEAMKGSGSALSGKDGKEEFQGVPQDEIDNHKKIPEGCFRCGRNGYRTTDCYAQKTIEGTALPMGKSSAVGSGTEKCKREDEPATTTHAPKQPKTAAVKAEKEVDMRDVPVWIGNSDESDF